MNLKTVTIDAQTLVGNPWVGQYLTSDNKLNVPQIVVDGDGAIAYYISQLASVETTLYKTPYGDITYRDDVDVNNQVPEHASQWGYRSYDGVTMGKFIGANTDDLPRVAQSAEMHYVQLAYSGIECAYSLDELRTSSAMMMPVDTMQAELAYRGSEEHAQEIAYFGDKKLKMNGLFNNPNVTLSTATKDYKTMNGQELFQMLNKPIFDTMKLSKNFHIPNTTLMFPSLWDRANEVLMTGYTDRTVMEHFKINNSYTLLTKKELDIKIRFQLSASELKKAGVNNSDKDRYMVYEKNERNLSIANPIPFRMVAPQYKSLNVIVPCEYKISGTEFRYPLCAQYVDMK